MSAAVASAVGGASNALLGTITAIFGLFAGLASLLAILGGVALTVRFRSSGVPTEAIVAGLPTRFFLSIGLDVTFQLLIFATLVVLAVVTSGFSRFILALLATAVLAYPFTRTVIGIGWLWLGLAAFLTVLVVSLVVRRAVRGMDGGRSASLAVTVGVSVLALAGVWRFAFEWLAVDVLDAKACIAGNQEESGLFIGENESALFIGVTSSEPARVVEIPRDDVRRVFIGQNAQDLSCPPSPPAPASAP